MVRSSSSRGPSRVTIGHPDGTTIVCVGTSAAGRLAGSAAWSRGVSSHGPASVYGALTPGGHVMARPPSTWTWAWKTVWPASGAGVERPAVALPRAPRAGPRRRRRAAGRPGAAGSPAPCSATSARCCFGTTRRASGACGAMSRNASVVSVSCTTVGRDLARHDPAEQAVGLRLMKQRSGVSTGSRRRAWLLRENVERGRTGRRQRSTPLGGRRGPDPAVRRALGLPGAAVLAAGARPARG